MWSKIKPILITSGIFLGIFALFIRPDITLVGIIIFMFILIWLGIYGLITGKS